MEKNPYNAFKVNVLGTKMMADLAHQYRVEKFLFVSTDKAVNPTNVMGATKRLAEVYVQSLNAQEGNTTQFIVTRFGNVLGSNGSVIPLFKKQIEQGGPVTVTHPEIIRYFMTIPEACQLVLEAVSMGKGGEIFVFDMGKPVKIAHLAKKMIRLSGFEPDVDIKIEFTGLRQGEKLFEELLGSGENELPTHHNKIKIAKLQAYDYNRLKGDLEAFVTEIHSKSHMDIVSFLKQEIPEYVSNNSIYELLDNSEIPS
jgi:FlaA1/EpsC-like NDP-sugar epimerase